MTSTYFIINRYMDFFPFKRLSGECIFSEARHWILFQQKTLKKIYANKRNRNLSRNHLSKNIFFRMSFYLKENKFYPNHFYVTIPRKLGSFKISMCKDAVFSFMLSWLGQNLFTIIGARNINLKFPRQKCKLNKTL